MFEKRIAQWIRNAPNWQTTRRRMKVFHFLYVRNKIWCSIHDEWEHYEWNRYACYEVPDDLTDG